MAFEMLFHDDGQAIRSVAEGMDGVELGSDAYTATHSRVRADDGFQLRFAAWSAYRKCEGTDADPLRDELERYTREQVRNVYDEMRSAES